MIRREGRLARPFYDPVVPEIASGTIPSVGYVRAYAEPIEHRSSKNAPPRARPASWFDGTIFVVDTETVEHRLTFGAYERYEQRRLVERAVFYRDDLVTSHPETFAELQRICRRLDVKLVSLAHVFTAQLWPMRRNGGTFVGFNTPYDLSRLADEWEPATQSKRRGATFVNGFAFRRRFVGKDGRIARPVFCRIKRDDRHHVRFDMRAMKVLDLSTLAHALTDKRGLTLAGTCAAFGVEFTERPGAHSGVVSAENVAGCLYDVQKTSELLWAVGREYDRHPIDLPPWRAQSGASIAKAYLRAFGVAPRSVVQPDFPKEYQGYAAAAYFGGRVQTEIVSESVPCVRLDALSAYPSALELLDLFAGMIAPQRLDVEELDASAIGELTDLLDALHEHPEKLLDRSIWPRLAFFALVDPNGATLPTRVDIPSSFLSRKEALQYETIRAFEEQKTTQFAYWKALDECGGRIVPDMVFSARRWRKAGEFADVPRRLLAANRTTTVTGDCVHGNIDAIAQHVRDATGNHDLTTSEVLDFFREHQRPTLARARRLARCTLPPMPDVPPTPRLITVGPLHSQAPLWYAGPDLANAAIEGDGRPRILRAWRLRPNGMQATLRPVRFRGEAMDAIDPRTENPFKRLIELRKRQSDDRLDNDLRSTGYKVIANSGAYGIFAQTSPEDLDPDAEPTPHPIAVHGIESFTTEVTRVERHGKDTFFPIASLVTAGTRLLVGLGRRLVHDAGGQIAYMDTDALDVVASESGGYVHCQGGPYRVPEGRAVKALSWAEVEVIRTKLVALNVYNRAIVPDSAFKLEDENFDEDRRRRQLYFFGTREKAYSLYTIDERGEPALVKQSKHVLGNYHSPIQGDQQQRWIREAWTLAVRRSLGLPTESPSWFSLPALRPMTLTTASVIKPYANNPNAHPFDFLVVAQRRKHALIPPCCKNPLPACLPYADLNAWKEQSWRCLACGEPFAVADEEPGLGFLRTYRDIVEANLLTPFEIKRLGAAGEEPGPGTMRGLTIPRHVHLTSITHVGKEIIVDPTDSGEEFSAEELTATEQVEYRSPPRDDSKELRAQIIAHGIRRTARDARLSVKTVWALSRGTISSRVSTMEAIEQAIRVASRTCATEAPTILP